MDFAIISQFQIIEINLNQEDVHVLSRCSPQNVRLSALASILTLQWPLLFPNTCLSNPFMGLLSGLVWEMSGSVSFVYSVG